MPEDESGAIRFTIEEAHDIAIALNAAILHDVETHGDEVTAPLQVRRELLYQFFALLEERLRDQEAAE